VAKNARSTRDEAVQSLPLENLKHDPDVVDVALWLQQYITLKTQER